LQTAGSEVDGMDFDGSGNLYVAYRGSNGGGIEVFTPGASTGTPLGITLNQPQGLLVDNGGNILVAETSGTNRIDLFLSGSQTPSLQIPIPNGSTPTQLTFKRSEFELFVSTLNGVIYGSRYPFASPPDLFEKDSDQGGIQGVALSDDQTF
jgi:sugar lactone lactonase YvrE